MNELSKQMQRDIVLVNELLSTNTEMGCVEFKHNNESPVIVHFRKIVENSIFNSSIRNCPPIWCMQPPLNQSHEKPL